MKNVSTFILSLLPVGTTVLSMAVAYAFSAPLGELISKKEQIKDAAEKAVRNAESNLESLFPKVSTSERLQAYDEMDGKNQTNKLCEAADLALEGERYVRERLMEICQDPAAPLPAKCFRAAGRVRYPQSGPQPASFFFIFFSGGSIRRTSIAGFSAGKLPVANCLSHNCYCSVHRIICYRYASTILTCAPVDGVRS